MLVGDPTAKRQLPFGPMVIIAWVGRRFNVNCENVMTS